MFNTNHISPFHFVSPNFNLQPCFWSQISNHYFQSAPNFNFQNSFYINNSIIPLKIQSSQEPSLSKTEYCTTSDNINSQKQKSFQIKNTRLFSKQNSRQCTQQKGKTTQRNETKNISKNFGKAILAFAKTYTKFSKNLLKQFDVDRQLLINYIKKARKGLNSLQNLRQMWGADNENDKLKKCLRIISYHFMRKHCLSYIFNSRIKSVQSHTKYRHRLMTGMTKPSQFLNIKQN